MKGHFDFDALLDDCIASCTTSLGFKANHATTMRSLLAKVTIFLLSIDLSYAEPDLPRGQKGRSSVRGGDRVSPGLQEAEINYEEAKILEAEAELLVRDAEKELEIIQQKKKQQEQAQDGGNEQKTQTPASDNDRGKPIQDYKPGLDEPREEEPHEHDGPIDENGGVSDRDGD
jgi:hypothetical protein